MPKSKRDKKISLTETSKKGLELKNKLVQDIRNAVDNYPRIFVFSVHNMRNDKLKIVRTEWKHSRFFFGKNKVMAVALGRGKEDEYRDNLHNLSKVLRGEKGLLFTNETKEKVLKYFDDYRVSDYARGGMEATQTIIIEAGPLNQFSHSMEIQLRQLGLPTCLKRGVITLSTEYTVCTRGQTLTPEQARILKLFGYEMATFQIHIEGVWDDSEYKKFDDRPESYVPTKILFKPNKENTADGPIVEAVDDDNENTDERKKMDTGGGEDESSEDDDST
ncbi:mRNA turnover protein 4 homolog [Tubulanus polymorphus]|uniref:mRNA turnover protein 4 homolog n=1 Tax=Tubulanus polymorphus TaxID=672921 RepID=UPI003DA57E88